MSLPAGLLREPFTVLDGGLSTALEALGEHPGGALWTAAALVDRPSLIVDAHRLHVAAGAELVISASYQASVPALVTAGLSEADASRALANTPALAREAGARWVAVSVGPYGALLADGSEYHGAYGASWDTVRAAHRDRIEVLFGADAAMADLVAVETMPSGAEAAMVAAEVRRCTDLPMWVSFTCADGEHTASGDAIGDAVQRVLDAVDGAVDAVGVNCTAPTYVTPLLERIARVAPHVPLVAYPNHGAAWDAVAKCWVGDGSVEATAALVPQWVERGARLIGGCCGVGAAGIAALRAQRDAWV